MSSVVSSLSTKRKKIEKIRLRAPAQQQERVRRARQKRDAITASDVPDSVSPDNGQTASKVEKPSADLGDDPETEVQPFDLTLPLSPKSSSKLVAGFSADFGRGDQGVQDFSAAPLFQHVGTPRRLHGGNDPRVGRGPARPRGMSDLFNETLELGDCEQVDL